MDREVPVREGIWNPGIFLCSRGVTGSRVGLRSQWGKPRGSSSLLDCTISSPHSITCQKEGLVVDWQDYYDTAIKMGMASDRILSRMDNEVCDVYGSEYRDQVIKRIKI